MKKRFPAFFLALVLCLGLSAPAFAADTTPVTVKGISFNAMVTDRYESWGSKLSSNSDWGGLKPPEMEPEDEFLYSLGEIRVRDSYNVQKWNLWAYLLDDDATLDLHVKKGEKYTIEGYYLSPSEDYDYDATLIGNFTFTAEKDGELVDRAFIDQFYPGANYLLCYRGPYDAVSALGKAIEVVFADENAVPRTVPGFTDLPSWCNKEALWASWKNITNGYGAKDKFAPGVECSQAEILTFLWRAANRPGAKGKSPFTVASWYQDAVDWAYGEGIIGDDLNASAPCTRAQAVTYIWKALGGHKAEKPAGFPDVAGDAPYAAAADWAYGKGVVKSYGGTGDFAPDVVCSRGQIACMLFRAYRAYD